MNDEDLLALKRVNYRLTWTLAVQTVLLLLLLLLLLLYFFRQPTRAERQWLKKHATEAQP